MLAAKASGFALDASAVAVLAARICQSLAHILLEQTEVVAGVRFTFYLIQALAMCGMGALIALSAL